MSQAVVVLVTAPNPEKAAELARAVVQEGLAACGNLVPGLRSIYRWKGEIHDEPETLIIFKTEQRLFHSLRERIVKLHPYECPEVLQLDVAAGHPPYLEWISANVKP